MEKKKRKPLNLPKTDHNWTDKEGNLHTAPPMTEEEWKERLEEESEEEQLENVKPR